MKRFLVFYADRLYGELTTKEIGRLCAEATEIYNGAYVWGNGAWWRCDGTPFPEDVVPKATRLMKMLLT